MYAFAARNERVQNTAGENIIGFSKSTVGSKVSSLERFKVKILRNISVTHGFSLDLQDEE